jgi:hypothetical protein
MEQALGSTNAGLSSKNVILASDRETRRFVPACEKHSTGSSAIPAGYGRGISTSCLKDANATLCMVGDDDLPGRARRFGAFSIEVG